MQHKRIMTTAHILTLSCDDRPGLVAAVGVATLGLLALMRRRLVPRRLRRGPVA